MCNFTVSLQNLTYMKLSNLKKIGSVYKVDEFLKKSAETHHLSLWLEPRLVSLGWFKGICWSEKLNFQT
jgi:hypothetical protein